MLMTLYSEFLLTLQIIFRLRRKCNFAGGSVRVRSPVREVPRHEVLRVTCCLINCTVPNLLRELRNSLTVKRARARIVQKFNHRKKRYGKLIHCPAAILASRGNFEISPRSKVSNYTISLKQDALFPISIAPSVALLSGQICS